MRLNIFVWKRYCNFSYLIAYQYNFLILKDVHLTWDEPADAKISNSPVDAGPRESLLMKLVSVVY